MAWLVDGKRSSRGGVRTSAIWASNALSAGDSSGISDVKIFAKPDMITFIQ
jgi:hypothetical protein